ncbi:MAG: hypothetical protein JOY54_09900 [Acidobacteriaceae bacterium]|nr:hypothetical protein [Acidobacteriaceae bacterium]
MQNGSVATGWAEVPKELVFAHLVKVLESSHFRSSKKCTRFLRHLVENAVESRFGCLKERTLGVDVFDRDPNYDTNQDPVVRGTAGEVRKRLAQYYLEARREDELRISLPAGTYVPEVHWMAPSTAGSESEPSPAPVTVEDVPPAVAIASIGRVRLWQRTLWVAAVAIVVCTIVFVAFRRLHSTPLDRFWAPVIDGNEKVLICLGQPEVYTFRPNTARALRDWFANDAERPEAPPAIASVPIGEIVPLWRSSAVLSDAQAFARLFNLFAREGKQADLRGERSVSLSDLRGRPSVLIGAFDNEWTLKLAGELRFYFDQDEKVHAQIIRDRKNPGELRWKLLDAWPPGQNIDNDYALVTRVVNRTTEKTLVILAGISQYGTEAAAEFVTNPDYFAAALAAAPGDWDRKNIQVVLSTRVISGVSGPPRVLAVDFW